MPSSFVTAKANLGGTGVSQHVQSASEQVILFAACGMLAFAVMAFGAVQEWAICVLECGAALLFALWAAHQMTLGRIKLTNTAIIPGILLLSLPVLQLASGRTAYFYASRYQLLQWLAFGVLFLAASEASGSSSARKRIAIAITIFGTLYSIFAMIQGSIAPSDLLYGVVKTHGTGFGSYTNRNHYAGVMEMLLPFGLVIATAPGLRRNLRLLAGFGSLLMFTSIFVSGSRGGMISILIAIMVFACHYYSSRRKTSKAVQSIFVVAILSSVFVAYFAYDRLASRSVMEVTDAMRLQIPRDSLRLVAQHPLLGSGLGTFTAVYPQVRSFPTNLFVNAAHNDYVQLAVETGLLGVLCTAAFLFLVFRNAIRRLRRMRQDWFSAVSLAAMVGCIALLVHGLFDFNLEIPANAAAFAFLAGLASAQPDRELERGH